MSIICHFCTSLGDYTDHDDDTDEEIGEDEVSQEEECDGEELTATKTMGGELIL